MNMQLYYILEVNTINEEVIINEILVYEIVNNKVIFIAQNFDNTKQNL